MRRMIALMLVAGAVWYPPPPAAAQTPWAMLARRALGRVEQLRQEPQGKSPGYEAASVLLDVPADLVFAKMSAMVRANHAVRIIAVDSAKRRFDLAQGDRTVSLSVSPVSEQISQLLVVGNVVAGEASATSHVVATVLRVCRELQKHCSAGE